MKGLLLAIGDFPEGNATATRLRLIARALDIGGAPVNVALLQPTLKKPVEENAAVSGNVDGVDFVYLSGNTVRPSGLVPAFMDTWRGIVGAARVLMAMNADREIDYLLLYTPSFLKHGVPLLVARILGIPVFVEACEVRSKATGGSKRHLVGRLLNFSERLMEFLVPRIAKGVIPISEGIALYYRNKGLEGERIFMLPILTDVKLYSFPVSQEVPQLSGIRFFLNSGSFVEKDGVAYIVEAFIKVCRQRDDVYLAFTGNVSAGDQRRVLEAMKAAGLGGRVIFVGLLSRRELVWAYQNAVGLLCCRTSSVYAGLGFPTKLGEYLASGTPVIVTRVGDVDRYLRHQDSALIAEPESVESIASCMQFVLDDSDRAAEIGAAGQKVAERCFHFESHAGPLARFISSRIGEVRQ
ncbi:glycosyltransferase [Thiohalobacter sp. IOR34]|uniref:glycosyltransferase n=1 Tax=Thiohalobacter sp. IOR34 TaxID=3057176 RepID=UPI0025AED92F|nr:glycosyltransferase [Thiohalobacter sp. IOR34]WJW75303.1 glycosyltransferase [Thiohalobacter sp. IOR34]